MMPLNVSASIKENMVLVGEVDYDRAKILMEISSLTQVERLYACRKEPETIDWIERNILPGDIFYDIGANVGAYSFIADVVACGAARIYAFEPGFTTYAALVKNALVNHAFGRVTPLPVALSDRTVLKVLHYSSTTPGAASHVLSNQHTRNETTVSSESQVVLAYALDDFVQQFDLPQPNLIKLDVDGAELSVLSGASNTLRFPSLRSILVEVCENHETASVLTQLLGQYGFILDSRHVHPGSGGIANWIFVRRKA